MATKFATIWNKYEEFKYLINYHFCDIVYNILNNYLMSRLSKYSVHRDSNGVNSIRQLNKTNHYLELIIDKISSARNMADKILLSTTPQIDSNIEGMNRLSDTLIVMHDKMFGKLDKYEQKKKNINQNLCGDYLDFSRLLVYEKTPREDYAYTKEVLQRPLLNKKSTNCRNEADYLHYKDSI